jgi:hypothetical protein
MATSVDEPQMELVWHLPHSALGSGRQVEPISCLSVCLFVCLSSHCFPAPTVAQEKHRCALQGRAWTLGQLWQLRRGSSKQGWMQKPVLPCKTPVLNLGVMTPSGCIRYPACQIFTLKSLTAAKLQLKSNHKITLWLGVTIA